MNSSDNGIIDAVHLRQKAEEVAKKRNELSTASTRALTAEEMRLTLYELQVHQIELEMQNEELRQAQVDLGVARARYFDLYDLAPVGYLTLDEAGRIQESNLTSASLLGLPRGKLNTQLITQFIHPEDQDIYSQHRKSLFETGAPQVCDLRMLRTNRQTFWVRLDATVATDDCNGGPVCRVTMVDITEQQQTQVLLERAHRLESLGNLAGGIAHDFNNIMTGLFGYLELIKFRSQDREPVLRDIDKAMSAFARARDLTQQMLTFAKGGAPVKCAVDVRPLLRETVEFALVGSNVSAEFRLDERGFMIDADPQQIKQVIDNLVINAKQAMPQGGKVTIETKAIDPESPRPAILPQGAWVQVTISDEGCGIAAENLPRIFDPFFSTKPKGTGLGLSMVHSVITRHGGIIDVASQPGHGSSFVFYLPAAKGLATAVAGTSAAEFHGTQRILVMDDERIIQELAIAFLAQTGCRAEVAANGKDAVSAYAKAMTEGQPFDLVILDLTVPGGMGGQDALQALRKIDPGVRAVVSSGYSEDPIMADPKAFGFVASLAKPYQFEQLTTVLRGIFG